MKIVRFLTADWGDYLFNRLTLYYYKKEQAKNKRQSEFTGDKNNSFELYEYYASNGIMPVETIDNGNGSFTHKYEDGLVVNVNVTLTGIVDNKMIMNLEKDKRRYLADYLNMSEEELINMSDDEIKFLVKKSEFNKSIKRVLKLEEKNK